MLVSVTVPSFGVAASAVPMVRAAASSANVAVNRAVLPPNQCLAARMPVPISVVPWRYRLVDATKDFPAGHGRNRGLSSPDARMRT